MNTKPNEELRKHVEDIVVDTSLHPVDASLRIVQLIQTEIAEAERRAYKEGERYGRANEHHYISGMLTNKDLSSIDAATLRRLKRRIKQLTETEV